LIYWLSRAGCKIGAVFYLSDIQRVFDIRSGKDVGDIAEYFSQLNQSEDKEKSNNPPIGKILVAAFILFFISKRNTKHSCFTVSPA
jgi:hypothetical protein